MRLIKKLKSKSALESVFQNPKTDLYDFLKKTAIMFPNLLDIQTHLSV